MTQRHGQVILLRLGEFAEFCKTTERTIRFYEQRGLLKPAKIDAANNYRYYAAEQLKDVRRIQLLQQLGLSLREIQTLEGADLGAEVVDAKLAGLSAEIRERQKQLRFLRQSRTLLFADTDSSSAFELETIGPLWLLTRRITAGDYADIDAALTRLEQTAKRAGIAYGDSLTIFHSQGYRPKDSDYEIGLICRVKPKEGTIPHGCKLWQMSAQQAIVCHYTGPYSGIEFVYDQLYEHVRATKRVLSAPVFEIYSKHRLNTTSAYEYTTSIYFPVTV